MSTSLHVTVLLQEAIDALEVKADGVYVDATFGRGGHTRALLSSLGEHGRVIALDRDPAAIEAGQALCADARLSLVHAPFSELERVLDEQGVVLVDGVLLDLGVSSPQLDEAARGMSFRFDAPLDMRMDVSRGITVAQWLAEASANKIMEVIKEYGEERFARAIATAIDAARQRAPIQTTGQLASIVEKAVRTREPGLHPATRTFQAFRIFINRELEELALILPQCVKRLNKAGRLVVISFHSLEDRIVKRFMRNEAQPDHAPKDLPIRAVDLPSPRLVIVGKPTYASAQEVCDNPRARSAVMRVAQCTGLQAGVGIC